MTALKDGRPLTTACARCGNEEFSWHVTSDPDDATFAYCDECVDLVAIKSSWPTECVECLDHFGADEMTRDGDGSWLCPDCVEDAA